LPFVFWSIVYLFAFSWKELADPGKSIAQLLSFIGVQFLQGTASHLWFVYVIVSMYLTFPFLSKWTKVAAEKEYIYFFILWIFFLLIDPYLAPYDINFSYTFFSGFIGYIVLGNYLFKTTRKFNTLLLVSLFLAGFLYTAIRTWFISINENEINEFFMDNLSLNVCLMAFCVYLIIKNTHYFTHPFLQKMISIICRHSYGIYLSHLLILNIFLWLGLSFYFINPLISIPLITFACLLISCVLIVLMKRIPFLKFLAG
jgi:surface polysaccharide O-acyltransferase-like enzyme